MPFHTRGENRNGMLGGYALSHNALSTQTPFEPVSTVSLLQQFAICDLLAPLHHQQHSSDGILAKKTKWLT